jgi:hypothetical protein
MSNVRVNTILDAAGGNTATINGMTPTAQSLQGFRNRIINGNMVIDQRNAGAAVTPTGGTYTLDRWQTALTTSSALTIQRSSIAPAGFTNSLGITVASAVGSLASGAQFLHRQFIEGFNFADLGWGAAGAAPITISFLVRSSVTGTFPVAVLNGGYNRSYVATYAVNAANTWEQKTVTIPGDTTGTWPTDNTAALNLTFGLGVGSTRTTSSANTWQGSEFVSVTGCTNLMATAGATFQVTGVQLEAGSVATPFERRDYGRELMMCQRYYQRLDSGLGTAFGFCTSTTAAEYNIKFAPEMRSGPSLLFGSASNYSCYTWSSGTSRTPSSLGITFSETRKCVVTANFASGASSAGLGIAIDGNSGNFLAFSSEL